MGPLVHYSFSLSLSCVIIIEYHSAIVRSAIILIIGHAFVITCFISNIGTLLTSEGREIMSAPNFKTQYPYRSALDGPMSDYLTPLLIVAGLGAAAFAAWKYMSASPASDQTGVQAIKFERKGRLNR